MRFDFYLMSQPYCVLCSCSISVQLSIFVFPKPSFLLTLSVSFPFGASHPISILPQPSFLSSSPHPLPMWPRLLCQRIPPEYEWESSFSREKNKAMEKKDSAHTKHTYRYRCVTLTESVTNTRLESGVVLILNRDGSNAPKALMVCVFDAVVHCLSVIV